MILLRFALRMVQEKPKLQKLEKAWCHMADTKIKTEKQPDELSFEDAMKRLEEISDKLENGQATLDESLSLYMEGIALVRHCNDKLTLAEQRIRVLDSNAVDTAE